MKGRILFSGKGCLQDKELGVIMFDSSSLSAAEFLSYFGRNTAVRVDHQYGTNVLVVKSARTSAPIAHVTLNDSEQDFSRNGRDYSANPLALAFVAGAIMASKNFPKGRKMNKAWSPIRFSAASKAMMESDSGIRFS